MIALGGNGWLTTLADLSLILFMVTAAALSQATPAGAARPQDQAASLVMAEPVAIFRPDGDPNALHDWLTSQPADPRQRLTILIRYPDGGESAAANNAVRIAHEVRENGRDPRIVMESGEQNDVSLLLAYDSSPVDVARQLHSDERTQLIEAADRSNRPEESP